MRLLLLVLILSISNIVYGQKLLKLYKGGTKQAIEYRVGEEITFQLKGDDVFYTFLIKDLVVDNILFDNGFIKLDNIQAVKSYNGYAAAKTFSKMLYIFGGSWIIFSGVDVVYGEGDLQDVAKTAAVVAGTSLVSGFLIDKLLSTKTHKLKGRKFLQIVEIKAD